MRGKVEKKESGAGRRRRRPETTMNHQPVEVRGKRREREIEKKETERERMFKEISEICCKINGSYSYPKLQNRTLGFFVIKDTTDQGMKYWMQMF